MNNPTDQLQNYVNLRNGTGIILAYFGSRKLRRSETIQAEMNGLLRGIIVIRTYGRPTKIPGIYLPLFTTHVFYGSPNTSIADRVGPVGRNTEGLSHSWPNQKPRRTQRVPTANKTPTLKLGKRHPKVLKTLSKTQNNGTKT